jgi:glycosyltransferase involved in cell wall biosynthesis
MRVLVLSRSYPSDVLSTLGLWVEHPTRLLAERCDIRVLASSPWCPPLPAIGPLRQYQRFRRIPRRETRAGIPIERPRFLTGPGRSTYAFDALTQDIGSRRAVRRVRSEFPFDLVHAHMIYPEGAVARRLGERFGVPFIVTEHAPWTEEWFQSQRVQREALQAAGEAAALLPVSTSVRETMVAYGVEPSRARVIPVGVDSDRFVLGLPELRRPEQILFVGWPNFVKGVDVLLNAFDLLRRGGSAARLLIAGGALYRNTRVQEQSLHALASSLGLDGAVTFLGRVSHEEVARLMAESSVLVLPSRAESFGAVLVEALACGTPVVATRCGGPEDIVSDEVGRLVPVGDAHALADALEDVLRSPERYDGAALRRYATEHFSWASVVDKVHDEYLRAA